jgi:hypothetical protein
MGNSMVKGEQGMTKAYGFTPVTEDKFLPRIVKEAKPRDKFLVVSVKNVKTEDHAVTVLIRKDSMPKAKAGFKVFDTPVGPGIKAWRKLGAFRALTYTTPDPAKAANAAKNEFQRVKNFLVDRVVRVKVEAL